MSKIQSLRGLLALVAIAFGVLTLFAGGRVLAGADPGYVVFRPLLVFNTLMGLAYVTAGVLIWRDLRRGRIAALAIFLLNLLVLAVIVWLYRQGAAVAVDSVRAMSLRTGVWLALFLGVAWLVRRAPALTPPTGRSPG
jgi:cbb3-type cytochrome oxidase subunit 3